MKNYLEGLNPQQHEAVLHTKGPLLVLAGAGAGKTKVLVSRILHLIEQGVSPENILAITFTNKAAGEMKERVGNTLSSSTELNRPVVGSFYDTGLPFISTFHSLGVYMLRNKGKAIGISPHFKIYDRSDAQSALREGMKKYGISTKEWSPQKIQSIISKQKGANISIEAFERDSLNPVISRIITPLWREYEATLQKENALDFDDLLTKSLLLLENEEIRKHYQKKWGHLHIDEYQDTNPVQYHIAMKLVGDDENIFVVGDGDQTIYTWRGANVHNILNFEKDFPKSKVVLLEQNYRSTKTILRAAQDIIEKNSLRKEKTLFTKNEDGEKIGMIYGYDEADEASSIARTIESLEAGGTPLKDIAVLYRTNFQSRALEEAMITHDIPHHVLGTRFFDRKEIKDMISYIRLGIDPSSISDIKRVINVPRRGIGKVSLLKIVSGKTNELSHKIQAQVKSFFSIVEHISTKIDSTLPSDVVRYVYEESGIKKDLEKETEENKERRENIGELITLATKYDSLPSRDGVMKFLDDIALLSDQDSLEGARHGVRLMTVHASKGLEFDTVFISGLEEGLFPQSRDDASQEEEEEERRLFYVALTRAQKKVFLAHAAMRTIFGSRSYTLPSEFLSDISADLIEEDASEAKTVYLD